MTIVQVKWDMYGLLPLTGLLCFMLKKNKTISRSDQRHQWRYVKNEGIKRDNKVDHQIYN